MTTEKARVIRPMTITPDRLVYSNVEENDRQQWNIVAAYAKDEWVMDEHKVYQALSANTGKKPKDHPNDWNDGGATNKYRMVDEKVGTQTERLGGIVMEIQADEFVDSIALLNVFSNSIKIQMIDPVEGVVFERTAATFDAGVKNWWQYFYKPIRRRTDVVIDDLPLYAGVIIRVELIVPAGTIARLGALIVGSRFEIGCARWGTSVGYRSFSRKEEDDYGNVFVSKGPTAKRPEYDLIIDTARVDEVMEELNALDAIPCVYIAHSRHTMTIAYGFYRELMTVLSNPAVSECTLTIEALT